MSHSEKIAFQTGSKWRWIASLYPDEPNKTNNRGVVRSASGKTSRLENYLLAWLARLRIACDCLYRYDRTIADNAGSLQTPCYFVPKRFSPSFGKCKTRTYACRRKPTLANVFPSFLSGDYAIARKCVSLGKSPNDRSLLIAADAMTRDDEESTAGNNARMLMNEQA